MKKALQALNKLESAWRHPGVIDSESSSIWEPGGTASKLSRFPFSFPDGKQVARFTMKVFIAAVGTETDA